MTSTPRIVPILVYADIEAGHNYLVDVFGFSSGGLYRSDDGTVIHAEVTLGDCALWLHAVTAEHQMETPLRLAGSSGGLSVQIDDVDGHFARVKAAGANIDTEPRNQDYGLREYGVRDPEGHRWWFSTPVT
jgi:MerR family transcriptional regulator, thiopeptide resistance regulator